MAQTVKSPPTLQETQVRSLSQEHPLEKGVAPHSSFLAWETPWKEEPSGLQFMELQSGTQLSNYHFHFQTCAKDSGVFWK